MKYETHREIITAIYRRICRSQASANEAHLKCDDANSQHAISLAGKKKAYLDCLTFIESKYPDALLCSREEAMQTK